MMCFTRLMQILTETFRWLHSFVTSIADIGIKISIAVVLFILVFMVLIPISETHTKFDTKNNIQIIKLKEKMENIPKTPSRWMKILEEILYMTIFIAIVFLFCFGFVKSLLTVVILMSTRNGRMVLYQNLRNVFNPDESDSDDSIGNDLNYYMQ